jgi:uncharacterized membrane protein
MYYAVGSIVCGLGLPRIEHAYLASHTLGVSIASAQACLSAVAAGMMVLTGIVFSISFVLVQFSAIAYSPRLALWFTRKPLLFHSLGVFVATFTYSLAALAWVDRNGSGTVPLISSSLVVFMLVLSVILFSRLVQSVNDLQVTHVLRMIGGRGRLVIREQFGLDNGRPASEVASTRGIRAEVVGSITQTLRYSGEPLAIASIDRGSLVQQATRAGALVVMALGVGDTVADGCVLLKVHGGTATLKQDRLLRAIRLEANRTFEQDPKYPIRLLVDIAIKALSPAINDPTTAVQAIDQIEDLVRRLGRYDLDVGYGRDAEGVLRLIYPMPTWEDYLELAFDEIRQYGTGSIQVMRRLRSALVELMESLARVDRVAIIHRYLHHLDLAIEQSAFDAEDKVVARHEDRQGLGLTRRTG